MIWLLQLVLATVLGVATAALARRKDRSAGWWFAGGFVGGLAAVILIAVMPQAGEPARMRAPLALAIIAVGLGGSLALLAVVAQLVG